MGIDKFKYDLERLLRKIAKVPGISQIVVFDNQGNILRSTINDKVATEDIINKSNLLINTVHSVLAKYGSGDKINLLSIRINTEKGNIYVIKGQFFSIAFLQEFKMTLNEQKALQVLEKIQKALT